ncbi:MAG: PEP-CTERM sorting domain-containing protein [Terrimicrobiaceae bacterium]
MNTPILRMKNHTSRTVRNSLIAAAMAVTLHTSSAAMLLEYKLDGNGTNTGTTGAGNDLTISGSAPLPTYAGPANPNVPGSTASFDNSALTYNVAGGVASAGGVTIANNVDFTFSGWLNNKSGAALTGNPRIFDKQASNGGFALQFASATSLSLVIVNAGGTLGVASSVGFGAQNTWEWFGVTYTQATGSVSFYNLQAGVVTLLGTNTLSNSVTGYVNTAAALRILNTGSGVRAYDGYADDLRVFNDKQTVSQMQALVPEPSTWALLAFSLTTVIVLRRRRLHS